MNTVDFKQAGGFPLTQDTLNFMQEANVGSLGALAAALNTLCGSHYVILSGCTDNGNNVDGGFVAVHGEVMQFIGGQKTVNVRVVKEKTAVVFKDGSSKDVYTKQYVEFGSSSEQIPWSEFKRVPVDKPWKNIPLNATQCDPESHLKARVSSAGFIEIKGEIIIDGRNHSSSNRITSSIPSEFAPSERIYLPVVANLANSIDGYAGIVLAAFVIGSTYIDVEFRWAEDIGTALNTVIHIHINTRYSLL